MQYTSKFALLAAAIFGASALAVPLAPRNVDYQIEAREADSDLSAREFYDMYLEARADPSLDAREVYAMDLEAREYLEYLEAREGTSDTAVEKPVPANAKSSSKAVDKTTSTESHPHEQENFEHEGHNLTAAYREKKTKALAELEESPKLYEAALKDKSDPLHHLAVKKYLLSDPSVLKEALADKTNVYHHAAKRIAIHRKKAKKYLSVKSQYEDALEHKSNKYHHAAVRKYLSDPKNMKEALLNKDSKYHKFALALQKHRKQHKKESTTPATGAEPINAANSTKLVDANVTHSTNSSGAVPPPAEASVAPKLTSRWY